MKHFFKKPLGIGIIAVVAIAVVVGIYWFVASSAAPSFGTYTVGRGNVIASVDEAGTVSAENNAQLSFQENGAIAHVYVREGDNIAQGAVIADLDTAALAAAAAQANASLAAAQAKLDSLKSGTRPEQIAINQSTVAAAKASVAVAVTNGYTAADDAVRNQIDTMFANPLQTNPTFLVVTNDSQMRNNVQSERVTIGDALTNWYAAAEASGTDPVAFAPTASKVLADVQSYLNTLALAVDDAAANKTVPAAAIAQYRTSIGTARTEIASAVGALTSAETALATAQNQLTLAQAGATAQDIEAQQAVVAQAQAAVQSAEVALDHASLVAPFGGTVNALNAKVGQVAAAGVPMLTLVNTNGLKIETYASDADVAKITAGDKANVALDAFGSGTVFPAIVTTVDTAESQVNGASAYKVTLHFTGADSRIKDGMTGNVHIVTAEHDGVIAVPSGLVISDNGNTFVLRDRGGLLERMPVTVGLAGVSTTEITSGLNVGDVINNF